jgi:hypothetical protein
MIPQLWQALLPPDGPLPPLDEPSLDESPFFLPCLYWQILCSVRGRAFVGSARGQSDMGRGPVAQDPMVLLFFCFSWQFFFSAGSLVYLFFCFPNNYVFE